MSPIRKVDDFRTVEIDSWDDYVREEIEAMHERGELENLPDQGQPIKIWRTEVNPEYDLAFSRLKNAGVLPLWMELDKEIGELTDALWTRLDVVASEIHDLVLSLSSPPEQEEIETKSLWQRFVSWFRTDFANDGPPPATITSIVATRDRERSRFLERAAELDKRIVTYHGSLPHGAEHLQRLRWLPERAIRVFDDRITLHKWW